MVAQHSWYTTRSRLVQGISITEAFLYRSENQVIRMVRSEFKTEIKAWTWGIRPCIIVPSLMVQKSLVMLYWKLTASLQANLSACVGLPFISCTFSHDHWEKLRKWADSGACMSISRGHNLDFIHNLHGFVWTWFRTWYWYQRSPVYVPVEKEWKRFLLKERKK